MSFTVYFFQRLFLPLLPSPVDFTRDFPATQFFKFVWLHVQKKWHTVTWKSKSRLEVKMVTKAEERTRDWMSLPYTGQWWGGRSCMRWSTSQSCAHTPAASDKPCSLPGQSETATAASTVIFSLQMHKPIAWSHDRKLEKRWGKFHMTFCDTVNLLWQDSSSLKLGQSCSEMVL